MTSKPATDGFDPLSDRDHRRVAKFIEHTAGIQLPLSKRSLIEGRLRKRQRALGYRSLHEYLDFALDTAAGEDELIHLLDAITTNKTDFYREPDHFRFLRRHIQGELAPRRDAGWKRPLRVWSAGCSTGEEPYTLAMELMEARRDLPGFSFEIQASDISVTCLQTAQKAVYAHQRIEPVPMELRKRYLMRSRDKSRNLVQMGPELREKISFRSFNLLTDSYDFKSRFDIIFCRNVMIYFSNEDRLQIAQRFAHALGSNGLLFIGHSETLTDRASGFQQLVPTIYRKTA